MVTPFGPAYPGPPGYHPAGPVAPVTAAGIVPLRPLTLTDIYNGAVAYVRAHPGVTLGLTAVVVVLSQSIVLAVQLSGLSTAAAAANLDMTGWDIATALVTFPATVILNGMLTVVVGRSVFGAPVTVAETWTVIRGRLWPLTGLAIVGGLAGMTLISVLWLTLMTGVAVAVIAGVPLILLTGFLLLPALYAGAGFAGAAIVLERLPLSAAIGRAVRLIRNGFWRVVGIVILTFIVTSLIGLAMTTPFTITGLLLGTGLLSTLLARVGMTIAMIVVLPFVVGVLVLLYTDRRIRAEAFDLAVQSVTGPGAPAGPATDRLWLTRAWA